jgi:hypothetical protein
MDNNLLKSSIRSSKSIVILVHFMGQIISAIFSDTSLVLDSTQQEWWFSASPNGRFGPANPWVPKRQTILNTSQD